MTPLVVSTTGGMANQATIFYKRLASSLPYSSTMSWLHSRITFSLIHSAIQCIQGSCSSCTHAARLPTFQWTWLSQNSISNNFSPPTATYYLFFLLAHSVFKPPLLSCLVPKNFISTCMHACTTINVLAVYDKNVP